MYLKWTSQNLTSFANSLSLFLSLESSFFLPSCKYDVSFRGRSCLHWPYWKNDIAPAGIERDWIPTYHETHVFAKVIRSFHCSKIGSDKFLAEWGSVYWLTAYCISMHPPPPPPHPPPPSLLALFIKKCCSQSYFAWAILVKQLQLTPFW